MFPYWVMCKTEWTEQVFCISAVLGPLHVEQNTHCKGAQGRSEEHVGVIGECIKSPVDRILQEIINTDLLWELCSFLCLLKHHVGT